MHLRMRTIVMIAALFALPVALHAQFDFNVDGHQVQIHSFASQGFAYSSQNNFLTMKTSAGSFAFTDGGFNVSTSLTDKFRVGAQLYLRNVGHLGKYQPTLDWGFADYKFKSWFGIRGGKIKTTLGLYNDTQDADFINTFALLPQSVYPLDLRDDYIAHTGGDVYGRISFHKGGSLRYTAYGGLRTNDPNGGYYYAAKNVGAPISSLSGIVLGGDLRWETPLSGLTIGVSQMGQTVDANARIMAYGGVSARLSDKLPQQITALYSEFLKGRWHFSGEFRRNKTIYNDTIMGQTSAVDLSDKGWFLTAACRLNKYVELGTYTSWYYVSQPMLPISSADHISDQAVTARFDLTKFWYAKVEGHFMDGYGSPYSAHGFYPANNPQGMDPTTHMVIIRTGVAF